MRRAIILSGLVAATPLVLMSAHPASADPASTQKCQDTAEKKAKRSIFGGIINNVAGTLLGRSGAAGSVVAAALPAASYLGDELLKMLDCKEQQQAAKATDQAIRGGVGTEVSWKSESRPNVTGNSKVTSQQQLADGGECLMVTDVVIVDGEETTVPKKMCRAKGASAYARV
jgi:hypothetical protein